MYQFLSTSDAARILGVTPSAVRQMANRGDLPVAAETQSGIRLFAKAEVVQLAQARQADDAAEEGEDPCHE